MIKKKEITINELARIVSDLASTVSNLSGAVKDLTKTVNDLASTVDHLALMTAKEFDNVCTEFASIRNEMATKKEMRAGFSMVMETLEPLHHDYEILKDDLSPRMSTVEARLTKVERKIVE